MKIQFENNLEYQDRAISSIVDIFEGQEICQSNFSVAKMTDNLFHSTDNECKKRSKSDTHDTSIRTPVTVSFGQ